MYIFSGQNVRKTLKVVGNPILTLKLVKLEQQHLEKSMYNVSLDETSKDVQDNPDTVTGNDYFLYE